MKKLIIALLLCMGSSAFAQVNLVRNGDFETYSRCPSLDDEIMLATGWSPIDTITRLSNDRGNSSCSAEYCHVCGTGPYSPVPQTGFGYQYPRSGSGMVAAFMYCPYDSSSMSYYLRDYLMGRLTQKLTAGKRYCVTFYVCLAEVSDYAIKEIGAYLDNGAISKTNYCGLPQTQYTPQVSNTGAVITDTMRWTRIEGSFIANGTEQFITIGNFKDRLTTTTARILGSNSYVAYYFVDDVSVVESTTKADAGHDTHVGAGDSVFIGRRDAAMECSWTKLGSSAIIGTGAGIWVKPTVATSYVVTQTLCGTVTKDTVRVEVWAAGVNSVNGQTQQYTLTPNPNDGNMQLWQAIKDAEPVRIRIYNALGATVYTAGKAFDGAAVSISLGSIAPGMYSMVLQDGAGKIYTLRFVKR